MFFLKHILFKGGIFIVFVIFFLIIFSQNGIIDYYRLSKEKKIVLSESIEIKEKNSDLVKQIYRLKNDKEYIEHVAKHEYGMAHYEEIVFRTIPSRKNAVKNGVDN